MDDCKSCDTTYQLGLNLLKDYESTQVDATVYYHLVGRLIYLTERWSNLYLGVSVVS